MSSNEHPLSKEEFDAIYSKVPRLTVEIIIKNTSQQIYLTKRAIEPCKGQWHLPGGTAHFGEPLSTAVTRIAERELGITVTELLPQGYVEYPSHYEHGLDSPVGIVFEVIAYRGTIVINTEAAAGDWFSEMPTPMHADQDKFLLQNGYLTSSNTKKIAGANSQ